MSIVKHHEYSYFCYLSKIRSPAELETLIFSPQLRTVQDRYTMSKGTCVVAKSFQHYYLIIFVAGQKDNQDWLCFMACQLSIVYFSVANNCGMKVEFIIQLQATLELLSLLYCI